MEEYDESSDGEPPEETAIIRKSESSENKSLIEGIEEPCSTSKMEVVSTEYDEEANSTSLVDNVSETIDTKINIESCSKIDKCENTNFEPHGQKRKKSSKKETKSLKKIPPLRTPRTEVVERKTALLEAVSWIIINLYFVYSYL